MFHEQLISEGHTDKNPNLYAFLKIVRIVNGSCDWMVDGIVYRMNAGDFVIFNNIDSRALTGVYGPEGLHIEQAILLPISLPPYLSCTDFFYAAKGGRSPVIGVGAPFYTEIDECFCELSEEVRGELPFRDNVICALFTKLVALCARSAAASGMVTSKPLHSGISEVMQYIAANISRSDLDCETLAKHFGYTKARFTKEFSHYTGMTVAKYIRLNRIQNVILLLDRSDINILDAAFECGFNSSSGFYKAFREITGKTPRECISNRPV
jgi:AraC-like DNA-binding protein